MITEIVIAKYNESLAWLDKFVDSMPSSAMFKAIVYDKSGNPAPESHSSLVEYQALPNVGRETHTYIAHIVENYYKLSDVTVFLQANPFDHSKTILKDLERIVSGQQVSSFQYISDWRIEIKDFYPKHHPKIQRALGDLYDDLFRTPRPASFHFNAGALFAVTRETIQERPKWFYEYCLTKLNSLSPVEGYCFERLWELIFSKEFRIRIRVNRGASLKALQSIQKVPVEDKPLEAAPEPKPFFKAVVLYSGAVFHETAIGVSDALTLLGIPVETRLSKNLSNPLYEDNVLWLVLGANVINVLPERYVVVQMEQTSAPRWITESYKQKLVNAVSVWEFSPKNIEYWRSQGIQTPMHHVPIRVPLCFSLDKHNFELSKRDINVLFYGCKNPRRERFYHHLVHLLKPRGFNVLFEMEYNLFGDKREELISRAQIVLNLHYYEPAVLETHRIEYLLAHGTCVMSEPSCDPALDAVYKDSVIFATYEKMADTILRLLQHPDRIAEREQASWNSVWNRQSDLSYIRAAIMSDFESTIQQMKKL